MSLIAWRRAYDEFPVERARTGLRVGKPQRFACVIFSPTGASCDASEEAFVFRRLRCLEIGKENERATFFQRRRWRASNGKVRERNGDHVDNLSRLW